MSSGQCLAGLRERRSGRWLSTPIAGPLVDEKADARQAGPRAVSAHVGQVWDFGGGSSLSFPPLVCRLSLRESLRFSSNCEAALWTVWRQASLSAAMSDHCWQSMLHTLRDFLRQSLKRFFGAPLSRWPVESLPYKTTLGRRWSSILDT